MSSFELDLAKFGQKALGNAEKTIRVFALKMHQRIVERTPVDTGRAKANNMVSIHNNPGATTEEKDSTPLNQHDPRTLARAMSDSSSFKLGDTIIIYNNVEYIVPLEYGYSNQAPAGMFRTSFNEAVTQFDATVRESTRG